MKQRKQVAKQAKALQRTTKTNASPGSRNHPRYLPEELAGMYKPVKKPVTLRLDADVVAWFRRAGRGYQTRINRALRKLMIEERKKERKKARE